MARKLHDPRGDIPDEFIKAYGEALLEWSYVENRLSRWFGHLTGLSHAMARAVFYSARSFQGRSDMLSAVIPAASIANEGARRFIHDALFKAINYSPLRNKLAHGIPVLRYDGVEAKVILIEGKIGYSGEDDALESSKFRIAAKNFETLANLLSRALRAYQAADQKQLQQCHELLVQLPNEPDKEKLSLKQRGRLRQQKAAQRGKCRKS
jgi:hypothetical protein